MRADRLSLARSRRHALPHPLGGSAIALAPSVRWRRVGILIQLGGEPPSSKVRDRAHLLIFCEFVHHLLRRAIGQINNLIYFRFGHNEGGGKAKNVSMRHCACDEPPITSSL